MIVDCPSCGATYNISDEKVRGRRVRVRCKNCSGPIIVDGEQIDADDATRVYQPSLEPNTYEDTDESTRVMFAGSVQGQDIAPGAWTVNVSEVDQRAMSLEEIVDTYNAGFITEEAFVWRDGMDGWAALMDVEEIRSAIESGQATQVVKPAALRAPARRAAQNPPTPVTYSAPAAPPRARYDQIPPSSVEYAPAAPSPRFAPAPAPATAGPRFAPAPAPVAAGPRLAPAPAMARPRSAPRNAGTDLFGGVATAGGEQELLRSSSVPLEQYEDRPTGARNESSVLFSLNTVRAGVGVPNSAPPRGLAASPPTAADILGMDMSGGLPGVDVNAALMSAPAVEPPPQRAVHLPPARDRMDTLPPTARRRGQPLLIAAVVFVAGAMVAGSIVVVRAKLSSTRTGSAVAAEPTAKAADPTSSSASGATSVLTPSAALPASASPAPPVAGEAQSPPAPTTAEATAPAPVVPAAPAPANVGLPKAPGPARPAPAVRPDKNAAKPEAPAKGEKKIVLEEEPSGAPSPAEPKGAAKAEAPAEAPAAESEKPPFDMSAAKAALEGAAASAAACKSDDGPTGRGKVQVTFSPSGRVTSANVVEGAFGGTSVGGCVAKVFRGAKVPAFGGDPVTVAKAFTIPE